MRLEFVGYITKLLTPKRPGGAVSVMFYSTSPQISARIEVPSNVVLDLNKKYVLTIEEQK